MFIRKNLGAAMLDRQTACATYPPGSAAWARFNCGPVPNPAYAPLPGQYPPAQSSTSAPITYTRPPPPPPPPAPVIVTVDNAAAQRAESEYNARLRAQMSEAEAQQSKSAAEAAALKAQREADTLRAQSNAGLVDWGGGAATYSNAGGYDKTGAPAEAKTSVYLWLALLAAAGFAVTRKKK